MTERIENLIENLRNQVSTEIDSVKRDVADVRIDVAVVIAATNTLKEAIMSAHSERTKISSEVGTYGRELTRMVGAIDTLQRMVMEMKAKVDILETQRNEIMGAGKLGLWFTKVPYALLGAAIVAIGWATKEGLFRP